jgi:hypothetical protein
MVHGLWFMVHGSWFMVLGLMYKDCGSLVDCYNRLSIAPVCKLEKTGDVESGCNYEIKTIDRELDRKSRTMNDEPRSRN